jgi:hypothetical protein
LSLGLKHHIILLHTLFISSLNNINHFFAFALWLITLPCC